MSLLDVRMQTYRAVVEAGSFSAASTSLFISAVSVKKQIDSLEAELGMKLLDRTNRGVRPTDAGEVLYETAKRMEQLADGALREMRSLSGAHKPTIRVGTSLLRPCSRLLELWSRIGTTSDFGIEVIPFDDSAELDKVVGQLGSRIDCFIGPCDAPAWHERCNVLKLGFYECKIAVPRHHPLAGKTSLSWDDLEGESLMLVKEGLSPVLDSLRHEIENHHPEISIVDTPHFYSIDTFNDCERQSTLMETLDAWENVHPGFVSLSMDWTYSVPFGLLYSKTPSVEMQRFVDELARKN